MSNINGSNDKDILNGSSGIDKIYGNGGDDIIYGHGGDDTIYGGAGNDTLYGGEGNDIVGGGAGDDIVYGGAGDDTLYGGEGNDILYGGAGANKIYGGAGNDTVSYADYMGTEDKYGNWLGITLFLNNDRPEYWENTSKDEYYGIENVMGSQYKDVIFGDGNDNIIWGNGGNDDLYGCSYQAYNQSYENQDFSLLFAGNDTFYTGSRKEGEWDYASVYLGLGHNIVYGGEGSDRVEQVTIHNTEDFIAYGQQIGKTTLHLGDGNNSYRGAALGGLEYIGGSDNDEIFIERLNSSSGHPFYDQALPINPMIIDLGAGQNNVDMFAASFIADIKSGSGIDRVSLHQAIEDVNPTYYESLKADAKIDVGDGDNEVYLYGANLSADVTAGKGNDRLQMIQYFNSMNMDDYEKLSGNFKLNAGDGNNSIDIDARVFSANVITGRGDDNINVSQMIGSSEQDYNEKLLSDVKIDVGSGNNSIYIRGAILNTDITAGSGNDQIGFNREIYQVKPEDIKVFGDIKVNAGDGNNSISAGPIGYGRVDIVSGSGDDAFELDGYYRAQDVWTEEQYASERTAHSGAGSDKIKISEGLEYFDIYSGSENDEIIISSSAHLTVDAGTGHDKVNLYSVSQSYIDMGAGNDEISLSFSSEQVANNIIKGGAGNDTYIVTSFYNGYDTTENTINNYDEDGGFDILKLDASFNKDINDYTAQFDDDDLLILYSYTTSVYNEDTSSYDRVDVTSTLRMDNYALGSDYQLNEFHFGEDIYTSDQFLAEMGLTL